MKIGTAPHAGARATVFVALGAGATAAALRLRVEPGMAAAATGVAEALAWGAFVAAGAVALTHRRRVVSTWKRRAQTACEHGHDIMWESSVDGRITFVSPVVAQTLGYAPGELLGQDVSTVVPADEVEIVRRRWASGARAGAGWADQLVRVFTKNGAEVVIRSTAIAMVDWRGRVVGYAGAAHLVDDAASRLDLVREKRQLIAEVMSGDALVSVAQPIVDLTTGAAVGAEMLARMPAHPRRPPDVWFRDAAEVGLLEQLELHALRRALSAAEHLPETLYVSVNLSATTLAGRQLPLAIALSGIDPRRIVLELTEHEAICEYEPLQRAMTELRGAGVRLAVDDAGAGYSSFRHILKLQPDFIKLDRDLVADIHHDAGRRALAAAFVMFALELNATVTAEGVETHDELSMLATLGIDTAQGFLLQRPTGDQAVWQSWSQHPFAAIAHINARDLPRGTGSSSR